MKINVGTYSFGRGPMSLQDKLKKAHELGYGGIELLADDLKNNSAEELKKMCAEAGGITPLSSHVAMDLIDEEMLEKFAAIGGKMMIVPSFQFANKAEAIELGRQLTEKAEMAEKYGVKIGYHNHTTEFFEDEGKPILEWTIESTEPGKVWFQLDCGWATAAGCDCPAFIRKHSGRFISIHVKENNKLVGTGTPRSMSEPRPAFTPPKLDENGNPIFSEEMKKRMAEMQSRMKIQCPMGDPSSRIDWHEIKAATDAQPNETAWTVERENDYLDDIVACLGEDVKWLKANIK